MGGQACVFYGAAEFSRDCDIVILAQEANFERLMATVPIPTVRSTSFSPVTTGLIRRWSFPKPTPEPVASVLLI